MKAFLKNYRQSPRKVRLVADLVKGKKIDEALLELDFLVKRASLPISKLIKSAVANAKVLGMDEANLIIKDLTVDKGIVMKRMMPRAMGRGARINKRTSHVTVILAEKVEKVKKLASKKVASKKVATKKETVK
ncbi:MAG: 50S ribosomal protein L22 [Candidatus Pacebacteria bacterium]|nr:50S ribosomal protein L22 [Candidatus Paceibacterota bacterium]